MYKFRKEKNQHAPILINRTQQSPRTKVNMQRVSRAKSVLRGEKINVQLSQKEKLVCNKFHEQKSARSKFREQKSAGNKFHEQNIFTKRANQFKSFTKR